MPLAPPALASGFLAPNLASVAHIGPGMPKFANAVALGTTFYLTGAAKVSTTAAGTLGVGATVVPLIIPPPLIQVGLTTGFQAMGMLGPMAPLTIQGLTQGLAQGLAALALIVATHPNVGIGAGIARITGPSAVPSMILGFKSAGMKGQGSDNAAKAIGIGFDTIFAAYILPIPVVGTPNIVPGAGPGFGTVV